jgi:hypothetical protein
MHIDKDLYKFCNLGDWLKYVNPKYYKILSKYFSDWFWLSFRILGNYMWNQLVLHSQYLQHKLKVCGQYGKKND